MKKRYFHVANIVLTSLITMIGIGGCKTQHKAVSGNKGETRVDTIIETSPVIKKPEPMKVVYGPPPTDFRK